MSVHEKIQALQAFIALVWSYALVWAIWPFDWRGRRREINLRSRDRDWFD